MRFYCVAMTIIKIEFLQNENVARRETCFGFTKAKKTTKKRSFKNPVHNNFSCGFQPEYSLPQFWHCFVKRQLSRNFKTGSTIIKELLHETDQRKENYIKRFFVSQQLKYKQNRSFKSTVHNYFICGFQIYKKHPCASNFL